MPTEAKKASLAVTGAHVLRKCLHRTDVWARQQDDGSYRPVQRELTDEVLADHVRGKIVVGTYLIEPQDNTVRLGVLDLDLREPAEDLPTTVQRLAWNLHRLNAAAEAYGLELLPVFSGRKGVHLLLILDTPLPASVVRAVLKRVVDEAAVDTKPCTVEVFPKQDRVAAGKLGNLVKLPWAKHRLGTRSQILTGGSSSPTHGSPGS